MLSGRLPGVRVSASGWCGGLPGSGRARLHTALHAAGESIGNRHHAAGRHHAAVTRRRWPRAATSR